jgi:hypothetical protein
MSSMCQGIWDLVGTFTSAFSDNWTYFVSQPWKQCTRQRKCYWWCLCCNKWVCWVGLIIVAIIVVVVLLWTYSTLIVTGIFCELLCVLRVIFLQDNAGCFGETPPPPSGGSSSQPPPPPFGTGSGSANQPR